MLAAVARRLLPDASSLAAAFTSRFGLPVAVGRLLITRGVRKFTASYSSCML